MDKQDVAAALEEMADLLEIRGENPFKVRSFRNGARAIEGLADDLEARVAAGTLTELTGIGKTLASTITELVRTGRLAELEALRRESPPGLLELLAIPGVGPKKAKALHEELGVASIDDLERACKEGRVAGLSGFGKKTAEKILAGIAYRRQYSGRFLVSEAFATAAALVERLRPLKALDRVEIAGSLRRRRETVKDIDVVATLKDESAADSVMEHLAAWEEVQEVLARGPTKASVRLRRGLQVDLRVVPRSSFAAALQYFTGSKEHNTALRGRARDLGFKLNEYGLYRLEDGAERPVPCEDEAALYRQLGLDWIPPELREDAGEIELARERRLPSLVRLEDLRGIVHVHTRYSDGADTVEAMAEAVRALGYRYLGVSDHSQSAGYAGGLKEDDVRRQHREIDQLNRGFENFRIFKGIESDIRADGSLDYPAEVLDGFDFVIASVHSSFQLPIEEQTRRVIRAMEDPHTTFLAHPTGRLLLSREGYAIDMEKVLAAAGRLGVAVEINAHPSRLDLDWRWGAFARAHGVLTAIHPDAHEAGGIRDVVYGVGVARKAGFSAAEVVNCLERREFESFLKRRRPR
jgi:DNA polymerase (family 10)